MELMVGVNHDQNGPPGRLGPKTLGGAGHSGREADSHCRPREGMEATERLNLQSAN